MWATRLEFKAKIQEVSRPRRNQWPMLGCNLSHKAGIWAKRLEYEQWSWDLSHKVGIWALSLGFKLETVIWAWGCDLSFEVRGGTEKEEEKEEEKKEEKFLLCESIGHRPLRGRCPKRGPTNQPTDRPTDQPTDRPTNRLQTDIAGCRVA